MESRNGSKDQSMHSTDSSLPRFYRLPEVCQITGLPESSLYRLVARRAFPSPIRITERTSGWLASEVHAWVLSRLETRSA